MAPGCTMWGDAPFVMRHGATGIAPGCIAQVPGNTTVSEVARPCRIRHEARWADSALRGLKLGVLIAKGLRPVRENLLTIAEMNVDFNAVVRFPEKRGTECFKLQARYETFARNTAVSQQAELFSVRPPE